MTGVCACRSHIWRDASLRQLFHRWHCNSSGSLFVPSPEQWELDLADVLPLQVPPPVPARTERSEGGPRQAVAHGR